MTPHTPPDPQTPITGQPNAATTPLARVIDVVTMALIAGHSLERAKAAAVAKGLDAQAADAAVAEARRRITLAADYARDEQIGLAVARLQDLYQKSIAGGGLRNALGAQKELNRLLNLSASSPSSGVDGNEAARLKSTVQLIESYLLPLELADATYPIEEHARLAAERIRRSRNE